MRAWWLASLVACTPTPPPIVGRAAVEPNLVVTVGVTSRDGRYVVSGERLRTGDEIAVEVSTSRAVEVYIGGRTADGTSSSFWPEPGQAAVIAAGAAWQARFALDPPAGVETLYVIASVQPIADMARRLAAAVGELGPIDAGATPIDAGATPIDAGRRRRRRPRDESTYRPDPADIIALQGKGTLRPKLLRRLRPTTITAGPDGVLVYVLQFSHEAP